MIYVLADYAQQPNVLLHPCKIQMFTEYQGDGYTHVYANPVHRTALRNAGFRLVSYVNGNDLFWTNTIRVQDLYSKFNLAFGSYFDILVAGESEYREIDLICDLMDSLTLDELPDAILRKVAEPASDPETAGMPWNVQYLRYALGYYDEKSFRSTIKGLVRAGKLIDESGNLGWVSLAVAKIEGFGSLRIEMVRRRIGVVCLNFTIDRDVMNGAFVRLSPSMPDLPERMLYWVFHGICTMSKICRSAPLTAFCDGSIMYSIRTELPLTDVVSFLETELASLQTFAVDVPVSRESYGTFSRRFL